MFCFIRTHQSHLINSANIQSYQKNYFQLDNEALPDPEITGHTCKSSFLKDMISSLYLSFIFTASVTFF